MRKYLLRIALFFFYVILVNVYSYHHIIRMNQNSKFDSLYAGLAAISFTLPRVHPVPLAARILCEQMSLTCSLGTIYFFIIAFFTVTSLSCH